MGSNSTGGQRRQLTEEQRRRLIRERKRRRRRQRQIRRMIILSVLCVIILVIGILGVLLVRQLIKMVTGKQAAAPVISGTEVTEVIPEEPEIDPKQEAIDQAKLVAAGYDYDKAINILEGIEGHEEDEELSMLITDYTIARDSLVPVDMDHITHIFYHTLVVDTNRAFNQSSSDGFKQWMTTTYEFDQITQQMYDRGYVLIDLNDMITRNTDANGKTVLTKNQLYLPEGKIPFVLSLDDLCYYHSYDGYGTAAKMVLDSEGKTTCEYYDADGKLLTGDYDCVPRLNTFLENHPDGAYRGARGAIAFTGYDGILGYRTDIAYGSRENLDLDQEVYLDNNPDFNYEQEKAEATIIANELKNEGWTLASHTWGHMNIASAGMERIQKDTTKFKNYVDPLIGGTDIIIFAHGADMAGVEYYDYNTNEKFRYMKDQGYNIFCNVDSSQYFLQYREDNLRMGRRNLDGYRLWNDVHGSHNYTEDIIDANTVLDPSRTDMPDL